MTMHDLPLGVMSQTYGGRRDERPLFLNLSEAERGVIEGLCERHGLKHLSVTIRFAIAFTILAEREAPGLVAQAKEGFRPRK